LSKFCQRRQFLVEYWGILIRKNLKQMLLGIKAGLAIVTLVGVSLFPVQIREESQIAATAEVLGASTQIENPVAPAPEFINNLVMPQLTSRSAFAYDMGSGTILYTLNFDQREPIASLTKLMTALVALEHLRLTDVITVQPEDIQVVGTNMGLVAGERIRVIDVLQGMLIPSSNDAAKTIAHAAAGSETKFIAWMNQKARDLGMYNTKFVNVTGLDGLDDSTSNFSTAYDLARLVNEALKNQTISNIVQTRSLTVRSLDSKVVHELHTSNKLMTEDETITGVKTGYTSLAKGNLIIRQKHNDTEVIVIVLGSDNREQDAKTLLDWVNAVYKW
jgi:D-alanyl-D-alanine carboxypeptidase